MDHNKIRPFPPPPPPPPPPASAAASASASASTSASASAPASAPLPSKSSPTTIPTKRNARPPMIGTGLDPAAEQEPPAMASSFLQYCATCENQIFIPDNSILYCSEACRRKDSLKPLSLCANVMTLTTPPDPTSDPPRPILPSRIPTGASHGSSTSSSSSSSSLSRIPPQLHNAKSDLDPTEWKPKLDRRGHSTNSEAFRYLSRFHQPTTTNGEPAAFPKPDLTRPHHRSSTSITSLATSTTTTTTHSQPQTPTTAPSSLSASIDYTDLRFDFNPRPLPPRHDPTYSSSAAANKGIELVLPYAAPAPAAAATTAAAAPATAGSGPDHLHFYTGEWEKKTVRKLVPEGADGDAAEGLGALFGAAAAAAVAAEEEK